MYDIIYDFILANFFNSTSLNSYHLTILGVDTNLNVWLSHTVTILFMAIFVWLLWVFTKWLFRVVSGLFLLK